MTVKNKLEKLYCYVDETGQDTLGRLFIVVAVITEAERQELIDFLENAEKESGGRRKQAWSKKDKKRREKYLDAAFKPELLRGKVFYEVFRDTKDFERLTAETVAGALGSYSKQNQISSYKATIIIDGLNITAAGRVRRILQKHNVKIDKIRGERDESSPLLRLADVSARLVRGATQNNLEYQTRLQKYIESGIVSELE